MEQLLENLVELGRTEKFNGEIGYGAKISSDALLEAMRVVGTDHTSQEIIDRFTENAPIIHKTLLSITFANYLQSKMTSSESVPSSPVESSLSSEVMKKARRSIRLLLNLIQRSPEFASKIPSECVELLETLIATTAFHLECLLILVKTADSTWLEFQKSLRYSHLLERILNSGMSSGNSDETTSILAYFSTLLERDYGFLSSCYAEMSSESFCEVLDVVRVILERNSKVCDGKPMKIHSNNLLFVINLLELITVDYTAFLMAKSKKEPKSVEEKRLKTVEMLNLVVEIVGEMCTNVEMTSHLNEKATAINAVVDVLDTILHAESLFSDFRVSQSENWPGIPLGDSKFEALRLKIEEEKRYEATQRRYEDRPKQPPPSKLLRVETSESLSHLAQTIFFQYQKIDDVIGLPRIGELKLNCLKAISNLCSLSPDNKMATLQNGRQGLLSVLQCTSRRPAYFMESYAMRNYSIFCVRQLTDNCQENKEVILQLGQPTQPIIDRKRLLKEFGIDENELSGTMNFNDMENSVYGNLEEDAELLAELAAIQAEVNGENTRSAPARAAPSAPRRPAPGGRPQQAATPEVPGVDPRLLAAALSDNPGNDDDEVEMDEELLNELHGLVGGGSPVKQAPPVPVRVALPPSGGPSGPAPTAPAPSRLGNENNSQLNHLRQLHAYYVKAQKSAEQGGESAKARRYKRAVDKLVELIRAVENGKNIDESEIPVAPPNFSSEPLAPAAPTAQPAHHPPAPPIRQAAQATPTGDAPPPIPQRKASATPSTISTTTTKEPADPKKAAIYRILQHRRNLHVANGKAAIAAGDKDSAKESVGMAKAFDQAIAALNECSADEMDMNEVPPSPPPYRKASSHQAPPTPSQAPPPPSQAPPTSAGGPQTFIGALEQRQTRYLQMAQKAKSEGNERKERMNSRLAGQYSEAIRDAKKGKPVNISELPTLPDMGPLPPQTSGQAGAGRTPGQTGEQHLHQKPPAPQVGPLAPSGVEGKSRNSAQLEFLLERQNQFKQAAIHAKSRGDVETAKKYLLEMKGFDKMIQAAQAGLPVNIKNTPIPPQSQTAPTTLEPRIQAAAASSSTGLENRGERLMLLEKTLIEQVRSAESNQMRFTRLGDVGKVKLFESWGKTAKQDLLLVREVAKRGLNLPKFHYETRQIPSADLFPDLAEDVIELTIISCRDVPLPSGYEIHHANLFTKYIFPPVVSDQPQVGKTKLIAGTTSPQFSESVMLNIGSGKSRNNKLQRVFKRGGLKFEVYQKGGFMRSDKLLGTCEWKLEKLEHSAEMEESLPLKDGRKAVGGLLSAKLRIREPIGDAKAQSISQKWLVLDN